MTDDAADNSKPKKKGVRLGEFWRAARFILPHRRYLIVSLIAAIFSAGVGTLSLPALIPVIQILLNDDNIPNFVDRTIIGHRLGVTLDSTAGQEGESTESLRIQKVDDNSPAAKAGLKSSDRITPYRTGGKTPDLLVDNDPPIEVVSTNGARRITSLQLGPPPWYTAQARSLASRFPVDPLKALTVMLASVLALLTIANIFKFFQEHYADMAAIWAVQDVRRKLYDHLLHLPLSYYGRFGTSDVTSRLVSDCNGLQEGFKLLLGQALISPLQAFFPLAYALYIDWRLTAFIIVFAPVVMAIIKKLGKQVRRATRTALAKNARMLGQLEASMTGIRVVKASRSERFERRRYTGIMRELLEQQRKMSRYEAMTSPTIETLTMIVVCCIVLFAAYLVFRDHSLSKEHFLIIMVALGAMADPLRKMSKLNNLLQRSNAAATRVFEVLDLPTERPRHVEGRRKIGTLKDKIVFDAVSFQYPGTNTPAVSGVTLEVPKGKVVAVVGRNGSGKTTLMALLPRFYEPTAGRILIDNVDIMDATVSSLRGQISVVTQESMIFPGTIAENIAYGHPLAHLLVTAPESAAARALRAEVESAAKRAYAHDFITAKPQGYDTTLDGLGGQLSGGQRQRLSIARALLRNAPILILDEATSQVDAESEHLIQQAIDTLMRTAHDPTAGGGFDHDPKAGGGGVTTFVIAHRFSTILSADEIVVMDAGKLVARGSHKDLLANSPVYRSLYDRQVMSAE